MVFVQKQKGEPMDDTIRRQDAIDAAKRVLGDYEISRTMQTALHILPFAQPEIIRCKDCKYNTTSKKCLNPNSFFLLPADDDFCSYAERRTDE